MFARLIFWLRSVFVPLNVEQNTGAHAHRNYDEDGDHTLNLGTDDRSVIQETPDSHAVAERMLKEAALKAEEANPGDTVTVTLSENHRNVHHMELMLSLMTMAPQYGLKMETQFNNDHSFTKL